MNGRCLISILSVGLSLTVIASSVPRFEARRAGARPSPAGSQASGDRKGEQRYAGRKNPAPDESERAEEQARAQGVPFEASPSQAAEQLRTSESRRVAPLTSGGTNAPGTVTVNSTGDADDADTTDGICRTEGGVCTLRAAIRTANATSGVSTIEFNIPGAGVQTINVGSAGLGALPQIGTVIINGYSQPGSSPNTLMQSSNAVILIELNGNAAGPAALGLDLAGGDNTIKGLVINRFKGSGIRLLSGGSNKVQGCFIGTNAAGTADLGNSQVGVFITFSNDNIIGGFFPEDRNVLSGNDLNGIQILDSSHTQVEGNLIGTNAAGSGDLGNTSAGIAVFNSSIVNIGGTEPRTRNVISGNDTHGVQIVGNGPELGTFVRGNFIGTDKSGTEDLGNTSTGIAIFNSSFNFIGGLGENDRNVISGNNLHGIQISGNSAANLVSANFIGTNFFGTADLGNGATGVAVFSSGNTIGGTNEARRNVISGNDQHGVGFAEGASGNKVQGNFIGTSMDGTADLGNAEEGVAIFGAPTNTIGGAATGGVTTRNVISGNGLGGVLISGVASTGNRVENNFIGTDVTGKLDLGNTAEGVFIINGASNNVVGGLGSAFRNVISGNDEEGIEIDGANVAGTGNTGTTTNMVEGNIIGLSVSDDALPNRFGGVRIDRSSNNTIGGTHPAMSNNIARNFLVAVEIDGAEATGNKVQGNIIAGPISAQFQSGVRISNGASNNLIGGAGTSESNNIVENSDGVLIIGAGTMGNKVQGNIIEKNTNDGVAIRGPSDNTIGGTGAGEGNIISENSSDGVEVNGVGATGNAILSNSIHSNGQLGIDLDPVDGVNLNDNGDDDTGPNNKQSFPVLNTPMNVGSVAANCFSAIICHRSLFILHLGSHS